MIIHKAVFIEQTENWIEDAQQKCEGWDELCEQSQESFQSSHPTFKDRFQESR